MHEKMPRDDRELLGPSPLVRGANVNSGPLVQQHMRLSRQRIGSHVVPEASATNAHHVAMLPTHTIPFCNAGLPMITASQAAAGLTGSSHVPHAAQASSGGSLNFGPGLGGMPQHAQHAGGVGTGVGAAEHGDSSGGAPAAGAGADLSREHTDVLARASGDIARGNVGKRRGSDEVEQAVSMGKKACDEGSSAAAQMLAKFHPPTDLGTLAESDALRTLTAADAEAGASIPRLPAGAAVKERLTYIGKQLDAFGRRGVILERYEMLGGDDRCQGGACTL